MTVPEMLQTFMEGYRTTMDFALISTDDITITIGGIVRVILIIFAAFWVSKLGQRSLTRLAKYRPNMSQSALYTISRIYHYAVMTVGVLIGLSAMGLDLDKFALFASALGVGVGFGLQTLISNFVAGLMLLFDRTIKVGDFVELDSGITGEVREINIRSTTVTTNDNVDIVVPNSDFLNASVTNWTMRDTCRRVKIPFGVSYSADKEVVRSAVLEAASAVEHTLKDPARAPQVWLVEFGDNSLNFELVVWLQPDSVKRPGAVQADYLWAIHTALEKADIEIPFPQRDVHIRTWNWQDGPGSDKSA